MQVDAATGVNTVCIRNLEDNHNATIDRTNFLMREIAASQVEVRELQERQRSQERRMYEIERQLAKSRGRT